MTITLSSPFIKAEPVHPDVLYGSYISMDEMKAHVMRQFNLTLIPDYPDLNFGKTDEVHSKSAMEVYSCLLNKHALYVRNGGVSLFVHKHALHVRHRSVSLFVHKHALHVRNGSVSLFVHKHAKRPHSFLLFFATASTSFSIPFVFTYSGLVTSMLKSGLLTSRLKRSSSVLTYT